MRRRSSSPWRDSSYGSRASNWRRMLSTRAEPMRSSPCTPPMKAIAGWFGAVLPRVITGTGKRWPPARVSHATATPTPEGVFASRSSSCLSSADGGKESGKDTGVRAIDDRRRALPGAQSVAGAGGDADGNLPWRGTDGACGVRANARSAAVGLPDGRIVRIARAPTRAWPRRRDGPAPCGEKGRALRRFTAFAWADKPGRRAHRAIGATSHE